MNQFLQFFSLWHHPIVIDGENITSKGLSCQLKVIFDFFLFFWFWECDCATYISESSELFCLLSEKKVFYTHLFTQMSLNDWGKQK